MSEEKRTIKIDPESASIQTHLSIIQNTIQRMDNNSSSCKTWCISIVSAILVIVADKGKPQYTWIALLPTIVFAAQDTYYLALEKGFRGSYNNFISNLHGGYLSESDLYSISPEGKMVNLIMNATRSFSVFGFYIPLLLLIFLTKKIAIG